MPVTRSYLIDKRKLGKAPFFRYNGVSGLITTIVAGTASAGHLYVLRNPDATKKIHIARVRILYVPTVAFGAAQAVVLALYKLTGYTVAHTGGTAITPQKRRTSHSTASIATARIATTAELTAGTHTIGAQPLARAGAHSTLPTVELVWTPEDLHGEVLEQDEGLLLRNEVLQGASGVGAVSIAIDGWES